jgi:hypothetical protein
MKKKLAGIAALAAFLVLAWGGVHFLRAQMDAGAPAGGMNRPPAGITGSGAAMIVYDRYLYVLSGPTLFKVNPSSMKVEGTLVLGTKGGAQDRLTAPTEGE